MKRHYMILAVLLYSVCLFSQAPQKMTYQAVIRDADNHLVTTQIRMQISILKGTTNGDVVYDEVFTPVPNSNGLVTVEIGAGDPDSFSIIDWARGPYFIKTETDPEGGTNYTITGVSQLLSVPFSLLANHAISAGFADYTATVFYEDRFLYMVYFTDEYQNESFEFWISDNDGMNREKILMPESVVNAIDDDTGGVLLTADKQSVLFVSRGEGDTQAVFSVSINGSNYRKLFDAPVSIYNEGSTSIFLIGAF